MQWQEGKPTVPGWYWVEVDGQSDDEDGIVCIYTVSAKEGVILWVSWNGNNFDGPLSRAEIVRFAGPIPRPQ